MNNQKPTNEKSLKPSAKLACLALLLGVGIALVCWASLATADGGTHGATELRWDLIHYSADNVLSVGGMDWAKAADGSQITLTGSGTWLAVGPSGEEREGRGEPQAVTGGGTWETFDPTGAPTGMGSYSVTGLVAYDQVPGVTPAVGTTDQIGNPEDSRAGLVILKVLYSDGEEGVLTISCHGGGPVLAPASVFEGLTATKGFVGYVDRGKPAPGVDANRTAFHIVH